MAKLSQLLEYSPELYSEFLGEVLKVEGGEFLTHIINGDKSMLAAVSFKSTEQGFEYWWDVMDKIKENESKVK